MGHRWDGTYFFGFVGFLVLLIYVFNYVITYNSSTANLSMLKFWRNVFTSCSDNSISTNEICCNIYEPIHLFFYNYTIFLKVYLMVTRFLDLLNLYMLWRITDHDAKYTLCKQKATQYTSFSDFTRDPQSTFRNEFIFSR